MPQTIEKAPKTTATTRAHGDDGRAREARPTGVARPPIPTQPVLLSKENLREIGRTLNGEHWQADMAGLVGCSKSQITRYLNGQRAMDALLARHLQFVLVERIQQLVKLVDLPGMPYAGTVAADDAIATVIAAMETVPGQEPPRVR